MRGIVNVQTPVTTLKSVLMRVKNIPAKARLTSYISM